MTAPRHVGFLDDLNRSYCDLHRRKENALWIAFSGLAADPDAARAELDLLEVEVQRFLQDPVRLEGVRAELAAADVVGDAAERELVALRGWLATFEAHSIASAEARALAAEILAREGELANARRAMQLGYHDPELGFVRANGIELGLILESDESEARRRAAWEGLRSIEHHVLSHGFLDIVRMRNRLGRLLGAEDFYDWRVRCVEGMSKADVFTALDELEEETRDVARRGLDGLRAAHGAHAVTPWNERYLSSGDVTREQDAYFPFEKAIERWARSFAALGVNYQGAELVLDLVDRDGKHEAGFAYSSEVAWVDDGRHRPARIHLTANAIPGIVGSGAAALRTLFHEGGHAAHFSNIEMPAPCFALEVAPTSVAFAETHSMFLESLVGDADWMVRYARTKDGSRMPWELIEKGIRARQPFAARTLRARLAVCYGERAIYEIPDAELTSERVLEELRAVERRLTLLDDGSWRPILAVPHLLRDDSSAYYHGYLLAKMAVHQTRDYFFARDGYLVDNPRIGPTLSESYWKPGNSRTFKTYVAELTGGPLSAAALARDLNRTSDEAVAEARTRVDRLAEIPELEGEIDLGARIHVVHGHEAIAELGDAGFGVFAAEFERWIGARLADRGPPPQPGRGPRVAR